MAGRPFSERLARLSIRRPRLTIVLWCVAFFAAAILVVQLIGVLEASDDFLNKPESKQAEELIAKRLPGADADLEVVVVRSPTRSVEDPAFRTFVTDLAGRVRGLGPQHIAAVQTFTDGPKARRMLVSDDGHTTIIPVRLAGTLSEAPPHMDRLVPLVEEAGGDGFTVVMTGTASWERDAMSVAESDLMRGEIVGLPIALLILIFVFGALIAAGLPLLLGLLAIAVALALTALVGQALTLSVFAVNVIATMGLAVGIDYSLFIVSRYREELRAGYGPREAVARAAATASRAVLFSGMTVVFALCGMLLVPYSIFVSMGIGAIFVVVAAVVGALTLLPAMLVLLGRRIDALRLPAWLLFAGGTPRPTGFWERAAHRVMRRPLTALVLCGSLLVALAVPTLFMDRGETGVAGMPRDLDTRIGYEILSREFSAGLTSPILVAIDGRLADRDVQQGVSRFKDLVATDPRFTATGFTAAPRGDFALLELATKDEATQAGAAESVRTLREQFVPQAFADTSARVLVGGGPATFADMNVVVDRYTPIVLATVLGLSFLLLLLAFHSLVIAVSAVFMNLLSVAAAYGLLTLVFQKGVGAGLLGLQRSASIESFVPLLLFCVLFGLSMDYQVFLLSRIREHYDSCGDTREAVAFGISRTAGIITGAALIMVAVFAGLASGELVMFQQVGFGLGVAIALDATLVRIVIVPSTMALLGERNWYLPRWLSWLPRVSVDEGPPSHTQSPPRARREGPAVSESGY